MPDAELTALRSERRAFWPEALEEARRPYDSVKVAIGVAGA